MSSTRRTRADRPGRNDPCPCGSGRKYKHCHLGAEPAGVGHHDGTSLALFALTMGDHDRFTAISLWDKAPFKPIVVDGEYTIWDFAAIPNLLRALAGQVGFLGGELRRPTD